MTLREKKIWQVVNGEEKKPDPNNKYMHQSTTPAFSQSVTYQQSFDAYEARVNTAKATLFAI